MCGIVGVLGQLEAAPRLLDALKRLEYRGYDSAGIATVARQRSRTPTRTRLARSMSSTTASSRTIASFARCWPKPG